MPVQVPLAAPITRLGQVRSARRHVAAARAGLQYPSPEELGRGIPLLDEAIACLRALERPGLERPGLEPSKTDLAQELGALQFELGVVRRLLEGGAEFYRGWSRILALAEGGYMPTGAPTPLMAPGSVSVKG